MHHDEESKRSAQAEEHEPLLLMEGLWVLEEQGLLVEEDRLRSSNETPCFFSFDLALLGSHSNRI
jgi:hypothetical protein